MSEAVDKQPMSSKCDLFNQNKDIKVIRGYEQVVNNSDPS